MCARGQSLPWSGSQLHHQAIAGERFLVTLADGGRAVSCVLGVLESPYVGLFDLVTDPAYRNRGHATALLRGLLAYARERGARHAYLQVTEANEPAMHVYEKLGFQLADNAMRLMIQ